MNIQVLGARVVIKEDKQDKTTKGGLIIQGREKEPTFRGVIISTGEGSLTDSGTLVPMKVKTGDRVIYTNWSGTPVQVDEEILVIINERDILAII